MSPAGGVRSSGRGHLQIGDKWDQNEEAVREHLIQVWFPNIRSLIIH
jgi:hypothetical protein